MSKYAYFFGVCLQGLVLGILLIIALSELWATANAVRLFRYQGF